MLYTDFSNEVGSLPISQIMFNEIDEALDDGDFNRYYQLQNELDLIERSRNGKKQSS